MKRTFNVTLAIEVECEDGLKRYADIVDNLDFMVASKKKGVEVTNFFKVDEFEVFSANEGSNEYVIELSDGTEVELVEKWEITDDDSYPIVEFIDCETNEVIGSYRGNLPDIDDEDFDMDKLIKKVEDNLY